MTAPSKSDHSETEAHENEPPKFVHLRLHTEYSLVDGTVRVKPLMAQLAKQHMPAVALTDRRSQSQRIEVPSPGCDAGGTVQEFLSYEGQMIGSSGVAAGIGSTDIGVSESSGTRAGASLKWWPPACPRAWAPWTRSRTSACGC